MLGQFVASNDLRDAGAVASARAAEIYGLNILAEGIQASFLCCTIVLNWFYILFTFI